MSEKQIDVEKLTLSEADDAAKQLGDKIREICDKAVLEANAILSTYGMEAKMQFAIGAKGEFPEKTQVKETT